jgi:hypothetical protein
MTDEEYQRTARALARETRMPDSSAARIEQAILSAIDRRDGAVSQRSPWLPPWLAAAAALVLIAGTVSLWRVTRTPVNPTAVANRVASEAPSVPREVPSHVLATPAVITTANAPQTRRATRPVQRSHAARVVRPTGFVELPWTAGLPAFESGEIVRIDVPVASLPAYGIDISSGADRPVEADILIGQDGFARAIRLVTATTRSTQ